MLTTARRTFDDIDLEPAPRAPFLADIPSFSLAHLAAFSAIAELRSLAKASLALRRSSSALSRSIAILEEKLARPLLMRTQRGVTATEEGEIVGARCAIIQSELDRLRAELCEHSGQAVRAQAATFQMRIDVARLRALIAVHEFGSIQRACHALLVSQPAVSTSIRTLEADLGVELFMRTPSGMIATSAGTATVVAFKRVLAELRKINDDLDSLDGVPTGFVCVGGLAYARTALLPRTLKNVVAAYPRITVRTVEGPIRALLSAMHSGEIDALICARPDPTLLDGVAVEPIARDPMGMFVAEHHPLARRENLTPQEVLRHPFILPPSGTITRAILDRLFLDVSGRTPRGAIEACSFSIISNVLLSTDHICFRSLAEFRSIVQTGRIVPLKLSFPLPDRQICVLQREGVRHTAAVREFLTVVRAAAAECARGDPARKH